MSTTDAPENPRILALFDVDGTLTIPRGEVTDSMMEFMKALSQKITVGIVGGALEKAQCRGRTTLLLDEKRNVVQN
jgi:hypothetical protein